MRETVLMGSVICFFFYKFTQTSVRPFEVIWHTAG